MCLPSKILTSGLRNWKAGGGTTLFLYISVSFSVFAWWLAKGAAFFGYLLGPYKHTHVYFRA